MKHRVAFCVILALLVLAGAGRVFGQSSAQERATGLRLQLSELETKQSALQTRLQELDEKLKPGNIEQSLAGVGSTRPEDLREQKRRELERERGGVQKQLDLLASSRTRLEASLARADAEAYRQSAAPQAVVPTATVEPSTVAPVIEAKTVPATPRRPRRKKSRRVRRTHHVVIQFKPDADPGLQ
jgi:membrane protein involved in colicin uptake